MPSTASSPWRPLTRGRGALLTATALCAIILLVTAILALTLPAQPESTGAAQLPHLARQSDIDLGVAVAVNPLVHDREYRSVVTEHYTSLTAENTMKWEYVQPRRHTFDWSGPVGASDAPIRDTGAPPSHAHQM